MALQTPLTRLLGIQHPIMLAGMNGVSHSDLAAAVSNAGPKSQKVRRLEKVEWAMSKDGKG